MNKRIYKRCAQPATGGPAKLAGERSTGTFPNAATPVCGLQAIGSNVTEGAMNVSAPEHYKTLAGSMIADR